MKPVNHSTNLLNAPNQPVNHSPVNEIKPFNDSLQLNYLRMSHKRMAGQAGK